MPATMTPAAMRAVAFIMTLTDEKAALRPLRRSMSVKTGISVVVTAGPTPIRSKVGITIAMK